MPCSLATYRVRIGHFYGSFFMEKTRTKHFFRVSFLYFIIIKIWPLLYPLKLLSSFVTSFLVSLCMLAFCLLFFIFAVLFIEHFLFSLCSIRYTRKNLFLVPLFNFFELSFFLIIQSSIIKLLLTTFGTIERNPGPNNHLKFGMWNVDSLLAREGSKKSMIEGLDSCHEFDIFGLCETYFTVNTPDDDIVINGFSETPFRADCISTAENSRP